MPTVEDMARGYMDNIASKVVELEKQLETLKNHLAECKKELKEKKK